MFRLLRGRGVPGLREATRDGPSPGVDLDEELARSSAVGALTHAVIATLADRDTCPSPTDIMSAVSAALGGFAPIEARAHRQTIVAGAFAYFRFLLPPAGWRFAGSEVALGSGRVDLLWRDAAGRVLIDEIKTGSPRALELTRTRRQVSEYLDCAKHRWPDRLSGLRLLSTGDPARSLFIHPDGRQQPLSATEYRRSA